MIILETNAMSAAKPADVPYCFTFVDYSTGDVDAVDQSSYGVTVSKLNVSSGVGPVTGIPCVNISAGGRITCSAPGMVHGDGVGTYILCADLEVSASDNVMVICSVRTTDNVVGNTFSGSPAVFQGIPVNQVPSGQMVGTRTVYCVAYVPLASSAGYAVISTKTPTQFLSASASGKTTTAPGAFYAQVSCLVGMVSMRAFGAYLIPSAVKISDLKALTGQMADSWYNMRYRSPVLAMRR